MKPSVNEICSGAFLRVIQHFRLPRSFCLLLSVSICLTISAPITYCQSKEPLPWPGGNVQVLRDLNYAGTSKSKNQKLDLYLPNSFRRPLPLIVCIHGGGWAAGDKSMFPAFLMPNMGYAVASINYRLTNEAPFPAQIDDCWSAVDWLVANQSRYGLDTTKIGLWGGSSGAHLALLMGLGYPKLRAANCKGEIKAVCDWCGPTNLISIGRQYSPQAAVPKKRMDECIKKLIGGDPQIRPQLAKAASPLTYLHNNGACFLVMHGDQDEIVPLMQSKNFSRRLTAAGAKCEFIVVPGGKHDFYTFDREKQVGRFFDKTVKRSDAVVEKKITARSNPAKYR